MEEKRGNLSHSPYSAKPFEESTPENFIPPGWIESILNYLVMGGVSPSELRGAHQDIDKLIKNADAEAKYARLSRSVSGRNIIDTYRVLNPDSTITYGQGFTDRFYNHYFDADPGESTLKDLIRSLEEDPRGITKRGAIAELAAARNNPYIDY